VYETHTHTHTLTRTHTHVCVCVCYVSLLYISLRTELSRNVNQHRTRPKVCLISSPKRHHKNMYVYNHLNLSVTSYASFWSVLSSHTLNKQSMHVTRRFVSPARKLRLAVMEASISLIATLLPALEPVDYVTVTPSAKSPIGRTVLKVRTWEYWNAGV